MEDEDKTKVQLINELKELRQRINELAKSENEARKAEEALRESEERFRGLVDSAYEGIIIYQEDKIIDANTAFANMFGYEIKEVIGKSSSKFVTPKSYEQIKKNIKAGYEKPYEIVGIKKDGTTFELEVIGKKCTYNGLSARTAAMHDITERKQTEDEIKKRIRELEEFYDMAVGREMKMIELKSEIKSLKEEISRYKNKIPR